VILGSGGAAKAVAYYLSSLVQQITIVSRDKYKGDLLIETLPKEKSIITLLGYNEYGESLRNADILINATPIGMYPNTNESLIPKSNLHQNLLVFDLVYNPRPTKLLKDAKEVGCRTLDGLTMLVYQGCGSFKIWTGRQAPEQIMKEAAEKGLEAMTR
jgi:shikimate dehydrogenase